MGDLVWVKILFCPNPDRIFSLTYKGLLFFPAYAMRDIFSIVDRPLKGIGPQSILILIL